MSEKTCEWRMNTDREVWVSCLCGDADVSEDQLDTFEYCPYCGGRIVLSMPGWSAIEEYGGAE